MEKSVLIESPQRLERKTDRWSPIYTIPTIRSKQSARIHVRIVYRQVAGFDLRSTHFAVISTNKICGFVTTRHGLTARGLSRSLDRRMSIGSRFGVFQLICDCQTATKTSVHRRHASNDEAEAVYKLHFVPSRVGPRREEGVRCDAENARIRALGAIQQHRDCTLFGFLFSEMNFWIACRSKNHQFVAILQV